ncbi:methionine ABC transporter ATP-binding protein [Sphingomonas cavernae]|uniref:Cell division ATP-binding protein FtsE n=1 Tax=Sphingomonas cavernae TaxID=2320861 RepID=A0A418W895_9SPHN|nr:ATP-binding cassette domain-containing protein [Sphingomonas cavernae]RJF86222.1 ATP-binding cassette domain-containing protein [Sphingomonas cavernae]
MSEPAVIEFRDVQKRFASNAEPALAGVTLSVMRGEIFGVIGQSGAGKSTLVRLINALERPGAGTVSVDGIDVASLDADGLRRLRRRIGMIFQNFGLLSSRTVAQNVAFPLRLAGTGRSEIDTRVDELLARVGLTEHAHKYPAQLSGGQKQRVGIARALATRPEVLLCDEATSALDPETTRSVLTLLKELNAELGLTIVLITHEMEVVRRVCDRVAVLETGRVVETGTVGDIFSNTAHEATRRMLGAMAEHAA